MSNCATPSTVATSLLCPSPTPRVCSDSCPLVDGAIQPSYPLLSPSPAFNLSQHQGFFQWVSSSHQMVKYWIFNFSICPSSEYSEVNSFRIYWFDLVTVWGALTSLLQSHNSSVLSLLYGPAPTSLHDYWKHHSFDHIDLCWQSNVSTF